MNKIRAEHLKKLMKDKKLNLAILTTSNESILNDNIFYYTGFKGYGLLIARKNRLSLVVSAIEFEKAKKTGINTLMIKKDTREKTLKKIICSTKKIQKIGIDKSSITLSQYEEIHRMAGKKTKFIDVSKELVNIRAVKDKFEIDSVKKACEVCDRIFLQIVKNFKFKTEKELATFIELKIKEQGLETSFNPIVSSGKNSSDVHHNPSGKIEKGFLIIDFGCKVNGYCSDMTRTMYVGKPSEKEMKLYERVLNIQETALSCALIGTKCSDLDKMARDELGEKFIHNLGHGVGLEIHEQPNLTSLSKDILCENMIITIEPGIYDEGKYGIRIEDTVLITKKGPVILTRSLKEMIIVGK